MRKILLEKQVVLDSEKKSIGYVEPLIHLISEVIDLPMERYYNILIAVTEAVNNAIIHGNKLDPKKKVTISLIVAQNQIDVIVMDQGAGFDPSKVADPRQTENLLKENGRGVFLIKELSNDCDICSSIGGTKVKMLFNFD
jgi:serine/threonine-protein kinase RsbW